jgi:hypothetical protein
LQPVANLLNLLQLNAVAARFRPEDFPTLQRIAKLIVAIQRIRRPSGMAASLTGGIQQACEGFHPSRQAAHIV